MVGSGTSLRLATLPVAAGSHERSDRSSQAQDARIDGLIDYEPGTGKVILSAAGRAFLLANELEQN